MRGKKDPPLLKQREERIYGFWWRRRDASDP
jgi:hypothetical protein